MCIVNYVCETLHNVCAKHCTTCVCLCVWLTEKRVGHELRTKNGMFVLKPSLFSVSPSTRASPQPFCIMWMYVFMFCLRQVGACCRMICVTSTSFRIKCLHTLLFKDTEMPETLLPGDAYLLWKTNTLYFEIDQVISLEIVETCWKCNLS